MKKILNQITNPAFLSASVLFFALLLIVPGCQKVQDELHNIIDNHLTKLTEDYKQVNIVANKDGYNASRLDANLVNGWGLTFGPSGIAWISANGTGLSLVLKPDGTQVLSPVPIATTNMSTGGTPTGNIFNGTSDFVIPGSNNGDPARFIFVGEDGVITAWNPKTGGSAVKVADRSSFNAVYKGIALDSIQGAHYLIVANFTNGKIDVFDKNFAFVTDQLFQDKNLPSGYGPFNVANINGKLFVAYAKMGEGKDEQQGQGLGFVDVFNADGTMEKRFASQGTLNAPWGMTWASPAFINDKECNGQGAILVGNFGDGRINAYTVNGRFLGQLQREEKPITISGLWGISFLPTTAQGADPTTLYFAAGPNDENDGLFGYLKKN